MDRQKQTPPIPISASPFGSVLHPSQFISVTPLNQPHSSVYPPNTSREAFCVSIHDPCQVASYDLNLIGIASIYPIDLAITSQTFRTWESFALLRQALVTSLPICIIPPLSTQPAQLPPSSVSPTPKTPSSVAVPPPPPAAVSAVNLATFQSRQLHVFLSRLSCHPLISQSSLFSFFCNSDFSDVQIITSLENFIHRTSSVQLHDYNAFLQLYQDACHEASATAQSVAISADQVNGPNLFPLNIYHEMKQHLDSNRAPAHYVAARSSVWNLCATTLEASQGLRSTQQQGGSGGSGVAHVKTNVTAGSNTTPSNLSGNDNQQSTNQPNATSPSASVPEKEVVLSDLRASEDSVRVGNYLEALSSKLTSLTAVLSEFDKQHTTLASGLGRLGGDILAWSRFELFHHENIRSILDSFAIALSRPYIESVNQPTRNQITDYIEDLIRQTDCVKHVLNWRISVSLLVGELQDKVIAKEQQYGVQSSISGAHHNNPNSSLISSQSNLTSSSPTVSIIAQPSISPTIGSVSEDFAKMSLSSQSFSFSPNLSEDRQRELTQLYHAKQSQQRYLDLMHAYMIIEIAFWRKIRRWEIRTCVRSYAVTMVKMCKERIHMWSSVEHEIGSHLTSLSPIVTPPAVSAIFPLFDTQAQTFQQDESAEQHQSLRAFAHE